MLQEVLIMSLFPEFTKFMVNIFERLHLLYVCNEFDCTKVSLKQNYISFSIEGMASKTADKNRN